MPKVIGPLYRDSKHLEEFCFLKIVYDLFPSGAYRPKHFDIKLREKFDSIMEWRE